MMRIESGSDEKPYQIRYHHHINHSTTTGYKQTKKFDDGFTKPKVEALPSIGKDGRGNLSIGPTSHISTTDDEDDMREPSKEGSEKESR